MAPDTATDMIVAEAPVLTVDDLRVDLRTGRGVLQAVRGISFTVARGETLCLVGESGCGKSMTSLAIMGLLPRSAKRQARRLDFLGENLQTAGDRRINALRGDRMAMIFQEPMTALNPAYTIGDQLMEPLRHHRGASDAEARKRAIHLLDRVGIASASRRLVQYPHQLSGGLRQRVMIAMALMCEPELLIADEPTTALDVTIQAQILRLLADLQAELGLAMVLITHDLGIVARIADRVAVMYAGEIVEDGPVEALFQDPRHPYTRGLLDCIPVPGKTKPGQRLGTIAGVVPSLIGSIAGCAFRDRCGWAEAACAKAVPHHADEDIDGPRGWRCIHTMLPADAPSGASGESAPPGAERGGAPMNPVAGAGR